MSRRRNAIFCLGLWLTAALGLAAQATESQPVKTEPATPRYVVYYFHGKFRCPTCLKIERLSAEAVRDAYADYLDRGLLEWRAVDVDQPGQRHYSDDFKLETSTLVVARVSGNKVLAYVKLERVWDLVNGGEIEFANYVQEEIERFMAG
jgi:hypothetical protein